MKTFSIFFKSFFILIMFLLGTACKVIVALFNGVIAVLEKTLFVLLCYFGGVGLLFLLMDTFFGSGGIWKSLINIIGVVCIIGLFAGKTIGVLCLLIAVGIKYLINLVCKLFEGISASCDTGLMNILTSLRHA